MPTRCEASPVFWGEDDENGDFHLSEGLLSFIDGHAVWHDRPDFADFLSPELLAKQGMMKIKRRDHQGDLARPSRPEVDMKNLFLSIMRKYDETRRLSRCS